MTRTIPALLALLLLGTAAPAAAQQAPPGFRDEFLAHFDDSSRKLAALARAMPAERFSWSPGEGVMPVERVFAHIARYNYGYPASSMGVPAPAGVDLRTMEETTGKEAVVELLERSADHVRTAVAAMPDEQLAQRTELYGREVAQWAVLMQLLAHMNEHLGQSIAYARMNGVVPPWSQ